MKFLRLTLWTVAVTGALCMNAQSTYKSSLPVKPGKGVTVAGTVECEGKPVMGVVVSDGYEVTKTDKKGAYYLKSKKQNPQVFITTPSGYDVWREDAVPEFWADFTQPADKYERHDFRLKKQDNKKHAIIYITDVHLANERNDVDIFTGPYAEKIREEVEKLNKQGIPVYTLNLGDSQWDMYQYGHKFSIADFRKALNKANYPTAVYSVMGNHDNDGHTPADDNTDFKASLPYQKALGPRYYSQNIGDAHYIFLDNIHYINDPAPEKTYFDMQNKRNYVEDFTPEQLDWLRKDLANVSYDTPIMLAMHGPILRWRGATTKIRVRTDEKSTQELFDILKPYKNVHNFTGHSHKQCLVRLPEDQQSFLDHNISGTCGSWWRTRSTGLKNLCPDGTPTGYELVTVDGPEIKWDHKTFEYEPDRQFFAWDMNMLKDYFKNNAEMQAFLNMYPKWTDYSDQPDNAILINLWAWDPAGKLKVTENGKEIPYEMVMIENPLYTTSYMVRNTVWLNAWDVNKYQNPRKFPLIVAQATTADAPIEISWTDVFGKETKSTLKRPAPFTLEYLK